MADLNDFSDSLERLRQFADDNPAMALLLYVDLDAEDDHCFKASLFPKTAKPGSKPVVEFSAGNLFDIRAGLEKNWNEAREHIVRQRVHQLAFTIMRLTDEQGYVSATDLQANGFHETEIGVLRDRALEEIGRFMVKGQFTIS